jgi:hypothetical protein
VGFWICGDSLGASGLLVGWDISGLARRLVVYLLEEVFHIFPSCPENLRTPGYVQMRDEHLPKTLVSPVNRLAYIHIRQLVTFYTFITKKLPKVSIAYLSSPDCSLVFLTHIFPISQKLRVIEKLGLRTAAKVRADFMNMDDVFTVPER